MGYMGILKRPKIILYLVRGTIPWGRVHGLLAAPIAMGQVMDANLLLFKNLACNHVVFAIRTGVSQN